jgi:integrase
VGDEVSESSDDSGGENDVIERVLKGKVRDARRRTLRSGVSRRLKLMLVFMADWGSRVGMSIEGECPSFLELKALGGGALSGYLTALGVFTEGEKITKDMLQDSGTLDGRFVKWMNAMFAKGCKPWKGEKALAALAAFSPAYSKDGLKQLPRAVRCLKGWRKLCPGKSKRPFSFAVWAAVATTLARQGHVMVAVGILVMVCGYLRVKELLSLTVGQFQRPSGQGLRSWAVMLFPSSGSLTSKTGQQDDSVPLDSPLITFLAVVFELFRKMPPGRKLVDLSYINFYKLIQGAAGSLGIPILASLGRHSGASIDRASGFRTLDEVQRVGRWASRKSMLRYEKMGRLNESWNGLSDEVRAHCQRCEFQLRSSLLDGKFPMDFDLRKGSQRVKTIKSLSVSPTQSRPAAVGSTVRAPSGGGGTSSSTAGATRKRRLST